MDCFPAIRSIVAQGERKGSCCESFAVIRRFRLPAPFLMAASDEIFKIFFSAKS
jgi:hypothetical protein